MLAQILGRRWKAPMGRSSGVGLVLLLTCACAANAPSQDPSRRIWDGNVRVYGALRAMFHEGQTGATATLDTILPNANVYALGALAELAGEVTVVGGRAYLSYPDGLDATRTESTLEPAAAATLLVVSEVPAWHAVVTEQSIPFERLDEEIARIAVSSGMALDRRFPFLLEGEFVDLEWHVIDGQRLSAGGASHQDHLAAAVNKRLERATATLVGFYSQGDQGVFTHMGSRTHIHCVLEEPSATGHVDHVTIPAGITVKLPALAPARSGSTSGSSPQR